MIRAMDENPSNNRSLAQHRVQARKLKRRSIYEAIAVVVLAVAMYWLIREEMHIMLKILCGLAIVSSAANGVGDYLGYKKRLVTVNDMEKQ